jgi:outer membrane lipoprotein-sorting protein
MILFSSRSPSAGQGYLRIDKNLWFYDPSVGKWERRTERERIGGTNSRRSDFDESRLAEEYDPTDEGEEKLGAYSAQKLLLKGKAGLDLAFPMIRIWIDKDTKNVLKRQEYALSGGCCARRITRSGRSSTAPRRTATSGTRKRSASTTRSRRRTRRWC